MKFRVERDVLENAVSWNSRSLAARPAVPILAGVRIKAAQDVVALSSFDYEISSRNQFPAEVEEAGEVLVSGRMLSDICKNLPKQPVDVELVEGKVRITCGSTRFELLTMPLEDYPQLPELPPVIGTVDAKAFCNAVSPVSRAASKDEGMPILTTLRIEIESDKMTLMATDRYRLAMCTIPWKAGEGVGSAAAMIKARKIEEICKGLPSTGDIELSLNTDASAPMIMGIEVQGQKITTQLTDGNYPALATLFPAETPIVAVIDRQELSAALKRAKLVTDAASKVRLYFTADSLTLEAGEGEDAKAREQIPCKFTGSEEMMTIFNPTYLQEALSALDSSYARLSFTDPKQPAVITRQEELDGEDQQDFRYLLMPISH